MTSLRNVLHALIERDKLDEALNYLMAFLPELEQRHGFSEDIILDMSVEEINHYMSIPSTMYISTGKGGHFNWGTEALGRHTNNGNSEPDN